YPEPLVDLNTIAYRSGTPGVQISSDFYASDSQALQVVVVERDDLGNPTNKGYAATNQGFDQLATDLKALQATDLVIVTHPASAPALPADLSHLDAALGEIGGSVASQW